MSEQVPTVPSLPTYGMSGDSWLVMDKVAVSLKHQLGSLPATCSLGSILDVLLPA